MENNENNALNKEKENIIIIIRPVGKMFINGFSNKYDDTYNEEIEEIVLYILI